MLSQPVLGLQQEQACTHEHKLAIAMCDISQMPQLTPEEAALAMHSPSCYTQIKATLSRHTHWSPPQSERNWISFRSHTPLPPHP